MNNLLYKLAHDPIVNESELKKYVDHKKFKLNKKIKEAEKEMKDNKKKLKDGTITYEEIKYNQDVPEPPQFKGVNMLEQIKQAAFINELEKLAKEKKTDKEKYHFGRRVGAYLAAGLPQSAGMLALTPMAMNSRMSMGEQQLNVKSDVIDKLKKAMNVEDVGVHLNTPVAERMVAGYLPKFKGIFNKINKFKFVDMPSGVHMLGSDPAIMSHEMGHHKNFKLLNKLKLTTPYMAIRSLSPLAFAASTGTAAFAKKDKTAKKAAIIGTAVGMPALIEEGLASMRGIHGLSKMYGGLGKALTHGGGAKMLLINSSYLLPASAPALAYGARKLFLNEDAKQVKQAAFENEFNLNQGVSMLDLIKLAKKKKHPVSESQRRWAFAAEERGELPEGKAMKWAKRAKGKDLPEKTAALEQIKNAAFENELEKIALSSKLLTKAYKKSVLETMMNMVNPEVKNDLLLKKDMERHIKKSLPKDLKYSAELFGEKNKKDLLRGLLQSQLKSRKEWKSIK